MVLVYKGVQQVFRWIPPGTFQMGSPKNEVDRYEHEIQQAVTLTEGYWLADSACTQALWTAVMGVNPSRFQDNQNNPVENVSWDDAQAFLKKLRRKTGEHFVLPTEAQWEYAARGPAGWVYPWGNEFDGTRLNFCDTNCPYTPRSANVYDNYTEAAPVGSYPLGQSWVAALDMSGNVWEWTADWYGLEYYNSLSGGTVDPAGPTLEKERIVRGSSWREAEYLTRAADRFFSDPAYYGYNFGFRVVRAGSGREGLVKLRECEPDAILLDIMMETMNEGYGVAFSIKHQPEYERFQDVPLIMLSSIRENPDQRFSRAEETELIRPDRYLTKPVDLDVLLATLAKMLQHA